MNRKQKKIIKINQDTKTKTKGINREVVVLSLQARYEEKITYKIEKITN